MCVLKMFMFIFSFIFIAISPAVSSVVKHATHSCSVDEFSCADSSCISLSSICDGARDCDDGSDEAHCSPGSNLGSLTEDVVLHRDRRQASQCRRNQWQCRDGSCISFDGKCDGMVDCPDKSDETHALCRKTRCQPNWFRCTYGACVDGTAPCNGIVECADQSDELLPRCRNETEESQNRFRCADGSFISAADHCDGTPNCPDGSDETVRACSDKTCPGYLFQCAYGACVDQGSDCNGVNECADGSDESDELCNRMLPGTTTSKPPPVATGNCVFPPQPEHGNFVSNVPNAAPGQRFSVLQLNVTCRRGYGPIGPDSVFCYEGIWSDAIPQCVRLCKVVVHPSVTYRCLVASDGVKGSRNCNKYEPNGTVISPECNSPNYYSANPLSNMRCIDGSWNHVATCSPECGRVTPDGIDLIIDGRNAKRGELPWHVGIYRKTRDPYEQICGGSLVSNTLVISAAHCFWSDANQVLPAANYAVAAGKIYRPWNNPRDVGAQKSNVSEIRIPQRFQGNQANFQDDIALLVLETAFVYATYIRPVCLNFDINFDRAQLQPGVMGKVAGWGLTAANGTASPILKVVELPYVDISICINASPVNFREYITSDKICAGYGNGTALCRGDSGGGLAFPERERGNDRYYLRGIVSTAASNDDACNAHTLTTFTQIIKHEHFIKESL
ncbi:modular serine protease-like [Helicoverpa zea]|uniref:modular serine protease-like n=1 Tax=Helicoverpa zea TaxID=7113 RepID=UPI001F578C63|nr:modular serine protease-like [Helicoverpa zea]